MHSNVVAFAQYGRQGGLIGGVARMAQLTPDERSALAARAANARWAKAAVHSKPYEAIKQMLASIDASDAPQILFVQGPRTWHIADTAANAKLIRVWIAEES